MKNSSQDIFTQALKQFSSTYSSEDNEEIHKQYLSIKKTLNSNPSLNSFLNKEFYLYEEECKVIETQTRFLFKDDWNTVNNKDDLLIQTNKTPQQFLIKVQFTINSDPLKIFSVLYESDFIGDWMKTIKSSRTLETTSIYRKKVQNFYNLPWPLNNRHSILNVRYYPMPLLNTILIASYTPEENFENPVNEGTYIEMVLPSASSWIKYNENGCAVIIILQANKYINSIPDWIVNFIIKSTFNDMVHDLKSVFRNFNETKYYEAMKTTHKHLYESLCEKLSLRIN